MGLTVAVKRNKNLGLEIDKFVLLVVKKLTVKIFDINDASLKVS